MLTRRREQVRALLWPTRRRSEMRHRELAELNLRVEERIGGLEAKLDAALAGQAELRTRLRRTQAMTARVYEQLGDWPGLLEAARADPSFALAYEDPDPLVSIPIPTYHSPDTLCERALRSVLAQTHANWEAIVVGDHCTDDTETRVLALGDPRISFHNLAVRERDPDDPWERWAVKGSVPRATGVGLATGRWIAPLSHDDEWDPDHLSSLLSLARERRAEVTYSCMRMVDQETPEHPRLRRVGAWPPREGEFNWQAAMFHGSLKFLRYDRRCALASEPNDANLMRRAWEAGVHFAFLERETATLYALPDLAARFAAEYAARGLPPSARAAP